jgi:hypothetical protein
MTERTLSLAASKNLAQNIGFLGWARVFGVVALVGTMLSLPWTNIFASLALLFWACSGCKPGQNWRADLKNRALDLATCDWVFSIDADERVTPELAEQLKAAINFEAKFDFEIDSKSNKKIHQHDAYEVPRLTQFCGQWIRHCGWTPDHVLRLFKRGRARFSNDLVHERLVQSQGTCGKLTTPMLHFSYPTLASYWRKLDQYSQAWAKQRHLEGKKTSMLRAAMSGMVAFVRTYFLRLGFLDGALGFAVCTMQAQSAFGKYFTLYCLNLKNK